MTSTVRINIKKTSFQKGSLAKLPWEGRSFDNPEDTRAYLLDRFFEGVCTWEPGDQVEAQVVKEAENGRFIYVIPPDAPAEKEGTLAPVSTPVPVDDGGYGEYVSPMVDIVDDVPDTVTLFVGELKRANQIIDRSAAYFRKAVTKICLRHRAAKMKLESRMDGWNANIRIIREMGGNKVMIGDLENYLSADGRELEALEDSMLGEIHRMAWAFIERESVHEDMTHVSNAESMFEVDEFDERTATSYPFVLWMYSHKQYPHAENAWKFLRVIEERTISIALGQKSL